MIDIQIGALLTRLKDNGLQIELTANARTWLARAGYDPQFGARPLRRAIQRYIENPLSVRLLRGDFKAGDMIIIDEVNGEITFTRHTPNPTTPPTADSELDDPFLPADLDALSNALGDVLGDVPDDTHTDPNPNPASGWN
jgi:hypothetical protein